MDVIVTATSGQAKVLDIMKVKPGAVITDVARPLDLSAEDVAKRPDVLVIRSGEIELPGDPHMKGIGLPRALPTPAWPDHRPALEGAATETFTVGRNIEWEKVKGRSPARPEARHEARRDLQGSTGSTPTTTSRRSGSWRWPNGRI